MARAVARVHGLDELTVRVLLAMAVEVRDTGRDGEPGTYFGGVMRLVVKVGLMPGSTERRRVTRCIARLVDAGIVVRTQVAAPGRNAEFRLTLEPLDPDGKPLRQPVHNSPEREQHSRTKRAHDSDRT